MWIDRAVPGRLSDELVAWARTQPDLQTAWTRCDRVDWLLDLGGALPLDDESQRGLVTAADELLVDDPWLLRLQPAPYRIAKAWAMRRDAAYLDLLHLSRFQDLKNAILVALPLGIAIVLLLQFRFHADRSIVRIAAMASIAAMYALAPAWGSARVRLTARAIRRFSAARIEPDVLAPARAIARRAPPQLQKLLADRFRKGWRTAASFPAPRLASTASP